MRVSLLPEAPGGPAQANPWVTLQQLDAYGAVILAAGFSRRLPGEDKLLKPYRGRPLLEHALMTIARLGLGDAVVVTRRGSAGVYELGREAGLRCVFNADAEAGMGGSIAVGAKALRGGLAGLFVVLGDMPYVSAADYRRLAAAHEARPARICVPVWEGRRGHPVLFGADHIAALHALTGDVGARVVLSEQWSQVLKVPAASAGVLADLDTLADFANGSGRRSE